jgi:hypothetical protein
VYIERQEAAHQALRVLSGSSSKKRKKTKEVSFDKDRP